MGAVDDRRRGGMSPLLLVTGGGLVPTAPAEVVSEPDEQRRICFDGLIDWLVNGTVVGLEGGLVGVSPPPAPLETGEGGDCLGASIEARPRTVK